MSDLHLQTLALHWVETTAFRPDEAPEATSEFVAELVKRVESDRGHIAELEAEIGRLRARVPDSDDLRDALTWVPASSPVAVRLRAALEANPHESLVSSDSANPEETLPEAERLTNELNSQNFHIQCQKEGLRRCLVVLDEVEATQAVKVVADYLRATLPAPPSTVLNHQDSERVARLLADPPEPNEALRGLMRPSPEGGER